MSVRSLIVGHPVDVHFGHSAYSLVNTNGFELVPQVRLKQIHVKGCRIVRLHIAFESGSKGVLVVVIMIGLLSCERHETAYDVQRPPPILLARLRISQPARSETDRCS